MQTQQPWKDPYKFTVQADGTFFELMSAGLYSNPIKAIIRELSTNAVDSHVEAKNNNPFDVHLPTDEKPYFMIRDYGTGLSNESVKEIWCSYFNSTKRDDITTTGQFGIGSKSPLSYVQSMQVISYFNGSRTRWIVKLDDDKCPEIIEESSPSDTDQPNGIKIQFTVPLTDHYKFYTAAKDVYQYFNLQPNFVDCTCSVYKPYYITSGSTLSCNYGVNNDCQSRIIMGNVAYDLDNNYDDYCLDLYCDVDTVKITPSRESVRYTNDTNKILDALINEVGKDIHRKLDEQLHGKFDTLYDKCAWYLNNTPKGNSIIYDAWDNKAQSNISNLTNTFTHDIPIQCSCVVELCFFPKTPDIHEITIQHLEPISNNKYVLKTRKAIQDDCKEHITIIIKDENKHVLPKVKEYKQHNPGAIYVLTDDNAVMLPHLLEFGVPYDIKYLSELPRPPRKPRQTTSKTQTGNKQYSKKTTGCYKYNLIGTRKFSRRNDISDAKYFVGLKTFKHFCEFDSTDPLNLKYYSSQQQMIALRPNILALTQKDIVFIQHDYIEKYQHLKPFLEYAKQYLTDLLKQPQIGEGIAVHYLMQEKATSRILEYLTQYQAKHKSMLLETIYNIPLFESWRVFKQKNTIDINRLLTEYYNAFVAFGLNNLLDPYIKIANTKKEEFIKQYTPLFISYNDLIALTLNLPS